MLSHVKNLYDISAPSAAFAAAADVLFILILAVFLPFLRYPFYFTEASKAHQLLPAAAAENVLSKT